MEFFKWVISFLLVVLCLFKPTLALSESTSSMFLREAQEEKVFNRMVEIRGQIHEHPEIGYQEFSTSKLVRDELDSLNIPYNSSVAVTGVIGYIGTMNEPFVALRADMDALPIKEEVEWEHKSKIDGKMHACGHDAHTAMLLGAAKILKWHENDLKGTVLLVFQPAEEGGAGAKKVLETGLLDNVKAIFALHVAANATVGEVWSRAGYYLAGSGSFEADIIGRGGHAGQPQFTKDPVVAAASVILSLQHIISRETDPTDTQVITVSKLEGSHKTNIIPDKATISGSIRAFSTMSELKKRVEEVIEAQAAVSKCNAAVNFLEEEHPLYPAVNNDKRLYDNFKKVATEIVGPEKVIQSPQFMVSDDFAFYQKKIPGMYFGIGIMNGAVGQERVHSPKFQIAEEVFPYGAALHASLAATTLSDVFEKEGKNLHDEL